MHELHSFSRFNRLRHRGRLTVGSGAEIAFGARFSIDRTSRIRIGEGCQILHGVILAPHGGAIDIGDRVSINLYSILYGHGGLRIGNDVRIAAHCVIVPANHVFERTDVPIAQQGLSRQGIEIGDDIWIGASCVVLDGARIASGCVIAAGSVVRGATEPNSVYGGVPARKLKSRSA